jgi:hypothetical protein
MIKSGYNFCYSAVGGGGVGDLVGMVVIVHVGLMLVLACSIWRVSFEAQGRWTNPSGRLSRLQSRKEHAAAFFTTPHHRHTPNKSTPVLALRFIISNKQSKKAPERLDFYKHRHSI